MALLRRRLARSCCCLQTRSGSTSARLRGWGGETRLADTRIPHHPHARAHIWPPSHLTAKRIRRRTQRRRAVASQTTSAMRPPRRRGGRRVPAAGPSSVAGPARPSWPARLPTREDRAKGQILGKCLVCQSFTATSRRNESDRRLAACTSVCALQFYTESILGTSSQSLVERSYGHSPLVCNDVEHCSTSLNTIE